MGEVKMGSVRVPKSQQNPMFSWQFQKRTPGFRDNTHHFQRVTRLIFKVIHFPKKKWLNYNHFKSPVIFPMLDSSMFEVDTKKTNQRTNVPQRWFGRRCGRPWVRSHRPRWWTNGHGKCMGFQDWNLPFQGKTWIFSIKWSMLNFRGGIFFHVAM